MSGESLIGAALKGELTDTFSHCAECQSLTGGPAELVAGMKGVPGVENVKDVNANATLADDSPAQTTHRHDGPGVDRGV